MSFRAGGHSAVTDQFKRAAMSIPLNASEGAVMIGITQVNNNWLSGVNRVQPFKPNI
jgi:hypothetical protein